MVFLAFLEKIFCDEKIMFPKNCSWDCLNMTFIAAVMNIVGNEGVGIGGYWVGF